MLGIHKFFTEGLHISLRHKACNLINYELIKLDQKFSFINGKLWQLYICLSVSNKDIISIEKDNTSCLKTW